MNQRAARQNPSRVELFSYLADLVSQYSPTTAMSVMRGTKVPPEARERFEARLKSQGLLEEKETLRGETVGEILEQVAPEHAR